MLNNIEKKTRQKPMREEKSRKNQNVPSFSSTLLDEIYRSIEGNAEKAEDLKFYRDQNTSKKHSSVKASTVEDEDIARFKRACLVEKWMDREVNAKTRPFQGESKSLQDNDLMFFSSTSSSSDSSGALSSSDTEFFGFSNSTKSRVSCFSRTRPKPIRTNVSSRDHQQDEFDLLDELTHQEKESLIDSKSRALRIYANLKKMKQPISPGGRLTSFINALFANSNTKKSKSCKKNGGLDDLAMERKAKSTNASSTCSSASSFSRSCLSKYSPRSREKMREGIRRTVRFDPVSVIVDEDCQPCGQKSIYNEGSNKLSGRPPLPPNAVSDLKLSLRDKNRKIEEAARDLLDGYCYRSKDDYSRPINVRDRIVNEDDDDDDAASDASSDLFELDHLALFGSNRFREELPVYETTRLDNNRVIPSGLIR